MKKQTTQNLADFRQRWRPAVGPGKEIPQKLPKVTKAVTSKATAFEKLKKKRAEQIRKTWRPAIGPASTI